jgi:hypothetical protein
MVNQFGNTIGIGGIGGGGGGAIVMNVLLGALIPVTISTSTFGAYHVVAQAIAVGGPRFICDVSKPSPLVEMEMSNDNAYPSADDTRLVVNWTAGGSLTLQKSTVNWNGMYRVVLTG